MTEQTAKNIGMLGGAGFALMAWREAKRRVGQRIGRPSYNAGDAPPISREQIDNSTLPERFYPASAIYHRILDNAAEGFSAYRAARKLGMHGDDFTVML